MTLLELQTGATLDYEHHNPGRSTVPIIALHGMLGTPRIDLANLIDWLAAQGYEVIAPTLRGYGKSTPKPRDFPPRFYELDADDVLALLDALHVPVAKIIGYSDGGEVALICAGKQPQRFSHVFVWGATGYFLPELSAYVAKTFANPQEWMTKEEIIIHQIYRPADFARRWVAAVTDIVETGGDVSLSLAPQITSPVVMVLGENDGLNPAKAAQHWAAHAQNAQVLLIPDTGHAVHRERQQQFRELLRLHVLIDGEVV